MGDACKGRVALVTGAAGRGMGRSIALTLAREGARVVVNYRTSEQSADAVVEAIVERGGEAIAVQADVFTAEGCRALVESAVERFGRVDVCIINPGGGWHMGAFDHIDSQLAVEDIRQEVAPVCHLLPLVLPGMYERKWGRVIAISLAGATTERDAPAFAYFVGKAARTQAILLARNQAWKLGVTVNVVAPGPVSEVEELDRAVELCDHGPAWQDRENITPQDVAEGVAFLCSDAGQFVSGCELPYQWR
jgi:NAD(P)-dependent dehydrogenase (short-subunit alcohol dehydrogenase family)